jgi:hypothetical protein
MSWIIFEFRAAARAAPARARAPPERQGAKQHNLPACRLFDWL